MPQMTYKMTVIDFLKSHNNPLEKLNEEFGISSKRHSEYPELIQLNYSQIKSPKTNPIVQDCRGLIVNESNNWEIVALPFRRFFNYGEAESEKKIDWSTAKVQEKVDGSLIIVYFYKDKWHIATRGTPDGEAPVGNHGFTFKDLFLSIKSPSLFNKLNKNKTYLFEVCSEYNRVVVYYDQPKVFSLSSFDVNTLEEEGPIEDENPVRYFPLEGILQQLNPLEQEGFVVVDKNGNRLKIKSPRYVALHHLAGSMSKRRLLELIIYGESEEVLSYFPYLKKEHDLIKSKFDKLLGKIKEVWESSKHIEDKKSFALGVKDYPFAGILFNLRQDKISSIEEGLQDTPLNKLEKILNDY